MWKISLVCLFAAAVASGAETIAVKWNETPLLFSGKTVVVKLIDGTSVRGRWVEVSPQSFTMVVDRTSKRKLHPKGVQTFDRLAASSIKMVRGRTLGRKLGTGVGILIGSQLAFGLGETRAVPDLAILPLFAATIAVGHAVGAAIDKDEVHITILPD